MESWTDKLDEQISKMTNKQKAAYCGLSERTYTDCVRIHLASEKLSKIAYDNKISVSGGLKLLKFKESNPNLFEQALNIIDEMPQGEIIKGNVIDNIFKKLIGTNDPVQKTRTNIKKNVIELIEQKISEVNNAINQVEKYKLAYEVKGMLMISLQTKVIDDDVIGKYYDSIFES